MCPVIRVSDELYSRLESHAVGFDTPSGVIERILDAYENSDKKDNDEPTISAKLPGRPKIIFTPENEDDFKLRLIKEKEAKVTLHKIDGTVEQHRWSAKKITTTSNLRANLWSGLLRNWQEKGIIKAELSIS